MCRSTLWGVAVLCAICFRAVYIVEYNDRLVHVTIYVIRRLFTVDFTILEKSISAVNNSV